MGRVNVTWLRWLPVMPVPGLKVTDAVVSIDSGGVPFSASASENAMLKHDECAAAMVIPCNAAGENRDVDLRFATPNGSDPIPSCLGTPLTSSVWYRVTTGAVNPSLLIQTCNTNYVGVNDSAVAVFTGSCGTLTEVACANNNCGTAAFYEEIRIQPALPNTDYYILVGGVDEFSSLFYELDVTCPAPVTLTTEGTREVNGTVHAEDGRTATTSGKVRIDATKPVIHGVRSGKTYAASPHITCTDALSGIAHCTVHRHHRAGERVTFSVRAVDKAGNVATRRGSYTLKRS